MKELQQTLKSSKIIIFVDSREPSEIIKKLSKCDCIVRKKQLKISDYLCSSQVCIERKSVLPDTPVIVNINGEISIRTIEDVYLKFRNGSKIKVMGLDLRNRKIGWFDVYDMTIHESDNLYGISFAPKRKEKYKKEKNITITTTNGHNVYVLRNKRILCLPTSKLKVNDYVLLLQQNLPELKPQLYSSFEGYLRKVQSDSIKGYKIQNKKFKLNSSRTWYKIPKINEDFFFILGLWTADGGFEKRNIMFSQKNNVRNKLIEKYLSKVFGNFSKSDSHNIYECGGKTYRKLFEEIVGKSGAENKHVPPIVFIAPKNFKSAFIRGYLFGDGWVNDDKNRNNPQLKATSKSRKLIVGLSYLLYSLGIENSVTTTFKMYRGRRKKYYELSIKTKSLPEFIKIIGQIPTKEIRTGKSKSTKIPYLAKLNFYKPLLRLTEDELKEFYEIIQKLKLLYEHVNSYLDEFKKIVESYPSKKEFAKKYKINYSTLRTLTNDYAKSSTLFTDLVNIIRIENGLKPINIQIDKLVNFLKKLNISTYLTRFRYKSSKSEALIRNVFESTKKKINLDSIFLLTKIYKNEIFLRRVSNIKKIKRKHTVYDFSVRGSENFVGGLEPVLLHNTHSDFVSSIIDGRLFKQVKLMKENFEKPIIIIEGYSSRKINENSLKGAIASLLVDFGISILSTKNHYDTAKTIYWIAKKEQEEKKHGLSYKVKKKPKELKKIQEEIVSGLPRVSVTISRRLLGHFSSIEKVFTASESELRKVSGVGKKLAKRIRKILTEKYG